MKAMSSARAVDEAGELGADDGRRRRTSRGSRSRRVRRGGRSGAAMASTVRRGSWPKVAVFRKVQSVERGNSRADCRPVRSLD